MSDAALTDGGAAGVVGRVDECERLEAFAAAVPGGARALLLRGEPGIGKTTIWRHGIERCRARGFTVLRTRPAEEEMPLALVGLDDLFDDRPSDRELAHADDLTAPGRAVLDALRRLSALAPVVVAVDDAQWLDAGTARALRYALRRLDDEPVGLLLTIRAGASDPLATTSLMQPGRVDAIELGPLALPDVRRLVGGFLATISRPLQSRIHEVSGGNPLYAIELARGLATSEHVVGDGAIPVSDSLQEAIERRVRAVPAELTPLLELVAVLGRPRLVELRTLASGDDLDAQLAAATAHGVLVVEESLEVRFSHPLLASAVYASTGPLERRALHAGVARAATDPDVRARHLALSTDEPDAGVAAHLEAASRRARERGVPELAADLAGHAYRLTPADDPDAARRRALAQIVHRAAAGEAAAALRLADDLVAALPEGSARAEALVERVLVGSGNLREQQRLLGQAVVDAAGDDLLRCRLLDRLGWVSGLYDGDLGSAIALSREALSLARRTGDARQRMSTSSHLALLETLAGTPRPKLMAEAVTLAAEVGDPLLGGGPRVQEARLRLWAGDLAGARALFEELRDVFARAGKEFERPYRLYDLALVECAAGNLSHAGELVRQGLEAARDAGDARVEGWLRYPFGLVAAWRGDTVAARRQAERLRHWADDREERAWIVRVRSILGLAALSVGDMTDAARELSGAARTLEEMGFAHPGASRVLPDAVEALVCAGDVPAATAMLATLERQSAAVGSAWATAATVGAGGVVALARGEPVVAAERLLHAAEQFDELGYAPDAARSVFWHGQALQRSGHRSRAHGAFTDARDRFAAMGATGWSQRVEGELGRTAPGRTVGELTPTESRIAALVTAGKRNREIAESMFLSVSTVEAHLTRIYRKLGIRSRSELARLVADGSVTLGGP